MTGTASQQCQDVLLLLPDADPLGCAARDVLAAHGYHVELTGNGEVALHDLLERSLKVLVVSSKLDGMGSVTFLRQARALRDDLAVVALAPQVVDLETAQLLAVGVDQVLVRPVNVGDIVQAVAVHAHWPQPEESADDASSRVYHEHLCLMLRIMSDPLLVDTPMDALRSLCTNLGNLFPGHIIGLFEAIETSGYLYVRVRDDAAVSRQAGERLAADMLARYALLTGKSSGQPPAVHELIEAAGVPEAAWPVATDTETGTTLLLPFLDEGQVQGVLALRLPPSERDQRLQHLPFLYLLASRLRPVFRSLKRVNRLAFRDSLTGLYNRPHIEDAMNGMLAALKRHGHPFAVVMLDLDDLKAINDTLGHAAGDAALCDFSHAMLAVTRGSDIVGRISGDEFVILLPNTGASGLAPFLQRLMDRLETPYGIPTNGHSPLASAGAVAATPPEDADITVETLMDRADRALYAAKRAGKARGAIWIQDNDYIFVLGTRSPTET